MNAHAFRVLLVRLGKLLPFMITFLVFISYGESLVAMIMNNLAEYDGEVVLYKPLSWFIASHFEYDLYVLGLVAIISLAIEACIWNKLAILYLLVQLLEKEWLLHVCLDLLEYYIVIIANTIVSLLLTIKGVGKAKNI